LANWLGTLSVFFSIVPILYIFHSELFPQDALIEAVVLVGGAGGSLLAALGAGLVGSRWWFIASLAAVVDAIIVPIALTSPSDRLNRHLIERTDRTEPIDLATCRRDRHFDSMKKKRRTNLT